MSASLTKLERGQSFVCFTLLTQSKMWTLQTVWSGDRAKVRLRFRRNCCICTRRCLQDNREPTGWLHRLPARWAEDVKPYLLTVLMSTWLHAHQSKLTHDSSTQITCIQIQCTWLSVCVCQQTDLQLRLTSVDVVSGLVEFLQLALEEREQQRDEATGRGGGGGERNVI